MGMKVGEGKGVVAEMNVVPLIDILLVLLIIFMVITPLAPKGLEAVIPQPADTTKPPPPAPDTAVVVQVAADGTLRINQQPADWETLGARLTDIFKSRHQRVAFIQGDPVVEFRVVARAIDIMHTAGIDSVGLLTKM